MMAAKINTTWSEDVYGNSVLLVKKNRGNINLDEVLDELRYNWQLQGHYVMILNASEATCGADWDLIDEKKQGDTWELYRIEEAERCPVCSKVSPITTYCPECGKKLVSEQLEQRDIRSKSKALLDAIIRSELLEAKDEETCLSIIEKILKEVLE